MPCELCGARQTDPVRGASPWKRGVRAGVQVLICPECQAGRDWAGELDPCPACGSTALVKALGETRCRSCGATVDSEVVAGTPPTATGLAADVEAAVDRVLRHTADGD